MLKAAPPPLPWVEETAPPPVGVLQAHFVSHRQFRLLDMHTVIPRGTDRAGAAGAVRRLPLPLPARASAGKDSIAQPQGG